MRHYATAPTPPPSRLYCPPGPRQHAVPCRHEEEAALVLHWLRRDPSLLLAALLVIGVALTRWAAVTEPYIPCCDEGSYIELGQALARGEGFTTRVKIHFYGANDAIVHPEDNRQPLFPLLLAVVFAVFGTSYFAAQVVSYLFGLLTVLLTYLLGRSLFGPLAGLLAALCVALDPQQQVYAVRPWTEPIFACCLLAALLVLQHGSPAHPGRAALLGALLAAAYLVRGNGLWLLPPFLLVAALAHRSDPLLHGRRAWIAFGVAWLGLLSPWFARQVLTFGDPFYTFVQHVFWLDRWEDAFAIWPEPPSLRTYLATHSPADALQRLLAGAGQEIMQMAPSGLARFLPTLLIGVGSLGARPRHLFVYLTLALHFAILAWVAPAFSVERFWTPLWTVGFVLAAGGVLTMARLTASLVEGRWRPVVAGGMMVALAALLLAPFGPPRLDLPLRWSPPPGSDAMLAVAEWLARETPPDAVIMEYLDVHQLVWLYQRDTVFVPNAEANAIFATAERYGVDYFIISAPTLLQRPALERFWALDGGAPVERQIPPFLELVYVDPWRAHLVYRFDIERYRKWQARVRAGPSASSRAACVPV